MNPTQIMNEAAVPRGWPGVAAVGSGFRGFPHLAGAARLSREEMALAGDLRLLVGECALIRLVREAVDVVVRGLPLGRWQSNPRLDSQVLFALLTYSYAAGAHASEDIEWNCQWDPATRRITAAAPVEQDVLRAFRRANRPWIEGCLAWVLEGVAAARQIGVRASRDSQDARVKWPDCAFLEMARRRVELAVLMDMAMAD